MSDALETSVKVTIIHDSNRHQNTGFAERHMKVTNFKIYNIDAKHVFDLNHFTINVRAL